MNGCIGVAFAAVTVFNVAAIAAAEPAVVSARMAQQTASDQHAKARQLPLRSGQIVGASPFAVLPAAVDTEGDRLLAMTTRNLSGRLPVQEGFTRDLHEPGVIRLDESLLRHQLPYRAPLGVVDVSPDGGLVFTTSVFVHEAYAVRLHLMNVRLPKTARLWVYGSTAAAAGPYGEEIRSPGGDIWSPTVFDHEVWLEVEVPAAALGAGDAYSFELAEVAEIFPPELVSGRVSPAELKALEDTSCLVDAACENLDSYGLSGYQNAVAHLRFEDSGEHYICSGALINDTVEPGYVPYLLTANHCFSSQASAASLEAYFDYRTTTCNGSSPSLASLPRTVGATLLATSEATDFTLVELAQEPASPRTYLGWTTSEQGAGTTLHRLAHPDGYPLSYTRSSVYTTGSPWCSGLDRPEYLYSMPTRGGIVGGSSGAPVVIEGGQVVGQLFGLCGGEPLEACDYADAVVDGAFRSTYQYISQWLNPDTTCISSIGLNSTVSGSWSSACSSTHRNGAYARYYTFTVGSSTQVVIDLVSSVDTYLFLLSGSGTSGSVIEEDDDDGGNRNSRITRTLAAGTYTIEATTYSSSTTGSFTLSLATAGGGSVCVANGSTMCLNNDRFKVTATYQTEDGSSGTAQAIELTGDTGYFWFFNQNNVEVVVKVLNGCGLNGRYWVFAAGLTNVRVDLRVEDTDTGAVKVYQNPLNTRFQPIQDTTAFSSCS